MFLRDLVRNSLAIQWLGPDVITAVACAVSGWGTKIPLCMAWPKKTIKKQRHSANLSFKISVF